MDLSEVFSQETLKAFTILGPYFAVVLGLIFGSFSNVIIYRIPRGRSIVTPGSFCPECGKKIKWWANIPLLSFIILRGKCSFCGKTIPIRYLLVEITVAGLFLASWWRFGPSLTLFLRDWPVFVFFVNIVFIDIEHRIIPDGLSIGGCLWCILCAGLFPQLDFFNIILGAVIGFGVFALFAWGYKKITGRDGLGGGDIKLLAMLGAFVGPLGVWITIIVSSVFGSIFGIIWALVSRKEQGLLKVAIPFGPFLILGALIAYFWGDVWFPFMTQM